MWRGKTSNNIWFYNCNAQHTPCLNAPSANVDPLHPHTPKPPPVCHQKPQAGHISGRPTSRGWLFTPLCWSFLLNVMPLTFGPTPMISSGLWTAMKNSQKGGEKAVVRLTPPVLAFNIWLFLFVLFWVLFQFRFQNNFTNLHSINISLTAKWLTVFCHHHHCQETQNKQMCDNLLLPFKG